MSKKCTIIIEDEVNCQLNGLQQVDQEFLYNKFAFFMEGYRYAPAFQLRKWDGKIRFYNKNNTTFVKILDEILPFLDNWKYEIEIKDKRLPIKEVTQRVTEDFFQLDDFKFRDYQVDAANQMLDVGSGFAVLATGAGKSSLAAALSFIFASNKLETLIIVPSQDLVDQTANEIKLRIRNISQHITVGVYSGGVKEIDNPIVVATWQSLQNVPHYMSYFKVVIVDESHGVKSSVIRELINTHGKHISYRFGLTGTFPKPETDQYALKTSIGNIICEVSASELIKRGFLSSLEINPIEFQDRSGEEFPDYSSEKAFLSKNAGRLETLSEMIMEKRDSLGNTLVLVNSIPQGRLLQELIPNSVFLSGDSEKELRAQNYSEFADKDGIIVIATVGIASTGISIDRIFVQWTIDIGKSFTRCIQSIGRSLRKKGDKHHAYIFDVYSNMKFSRKHFKKRKEYYDEAGYPVSKVLKVQPKFTSGLIE